MPARLHAMYGGTGCLVLVVESPGHVLWFHWSWTSFNVDAGNILVDAARRWD
jgi:hypothetical protein